MGRVLPALKKKNPTNKPNPQKKPQKTKQKPKQTKNLLIYLLRNTQIFLLFYFWNTLVHRPHSCYSLPNENQNFLLPSL